MNAAVNGLEITHDSPRGEEHRYRNRVITIQAVMEALVEVSVRYQEIFQKIVLQSISDDDIVNTQDPALPFWGPWLPKDVNIVAQRMYGPSGSTWYFGKAGFPRPPYYRFYASLHQDFFQSLIDRVLSQGKKRQWGLFIKTKTRHPKHRGKKSDLLCLRVPHR